jgi:hypothetical protein
MNRFFYLLLLILTLNSCAELQHVSREIANSRSLSEQQIADGLQQALSKGVDKQVSKLTRENGFYSNSLVRIGLPEELSKIESTLRSLGLNNLADEGVKALNTTAQKAVEEATPIFLSAIQQMSFEDSKAILLGENTAATAYLRRKTQAELYTKFEPIIKNNFQKTGADQIWETLIEKYNQVPFTQNVNPDLTDYVTTQALKGVYKMIELEEIEIRTNIRERSSQLLRQVFALQD